MVFKKIDPNAWKPEKVGDMIEGVLVKAEPSQSYDNKVYGIQTSDGAQFVVFGTTVLDNRMGYVRVGDTVRIVYQGTEKNKKNQPTKLFDVFLSDGKE